MSSDIKEPESEQQKKFFEYLVEGTTDDNGVFKFNTPKEAAAKAGYSQYESVYHIIRKYKDYYLNRLNEKMLLHLPKAMEVQINAMDYDGKQIGLEQRQKAAMDIMDRAGLIKKDKLEITASGGAGIFILPAKDVDKELDDGERKA